MRALETRDPSTVLSAHFAAASGRTGIHPAEFRRWPPSGLLGLGLSYFHGGPFTPARRELGVALVLGADLCSGGEFQFRDYVGNSLNYLDPASRKGTSPGPTFEEVLQTATRLHQTYCATSVSNTLD